MLDAFLGNGLDDAIDIDPGQMNLVGVERARLDDLVDFCDGEASGGCHLWIKVSCCCVEDQVSEVVRLGGFDEREVEAIMGGNALRVLRELLPAPGVAAADCAERSRLLESSAIG